MKRTRGRGRFVASVILLASLPGGCASFLNPSTDYEDVTKRRSAEQTYFEDSADVFFADFPNPYRDKEVLWFSSYAQGRVEVYLHDASNDFVTSILTFDKQESPLYPLVYHSAGERIVKCVIRVDGREKCAKLFPWILPLPHPQWGTSYTIEQFE
jgi:hypothetical protein